MAAPILKPAAAPPGSRIAVIAPASSAKTERIDLGIAGLRTRGYEIVEGRHLRGRSPQYFSGTVEERLEDFHAAFADPAVDAIICSRGGYGSNYLLEQVDVNLVRANPKPFFAYSDMTVLQNALLDRSGLVTFHGPMASTKRVSRPQSPAEWQRSAARKGCEPCARGGFREPCMADA
jgi:muramoyltetrapeptide carboxypeptidase